MKKVSASAPARRVAVVDEAGLLGPARYDYADAFAIDLGQADPRSAEQFARCALEQVPSLVRWTVRIAQRSVLRLRLRPHSSPDNVLGWPIVTAQQRLLQLEAQSPLLGRAVIVGRRSDTGQVTITTFFF